MSLGPSNYQVRSGLELCIGCGLCVKRCPMGALQLQDYPEAKNRITKVVAKNKNGEVELRNKKGQVSVLNPDLCIGCGFCAYICPTGAITLEDSGRTRKVCTPYVTVEFKLKKCEVCGNYFASEKQLDYIAKVSGLPSETVNECPTCRRKLLTVALCRTI